MCFEMLLWWTHISNEKPGGLIWSIRQSRIGRPPNPCCVWYLSHTYNLVAFAITPHNPSLRALYWTYMAPRVESPPRNKHAGCTQLHLVLGDLVLRPRHHPPTQAWQGAQLILWERMIPKSWRRGWKQMVLVDWTSPRPFFFPPRVLPNGNWHFITVLLSSCSKADGEKNFSLGPFWFVNVDSKMLFLC